MMGGRLTKVQELTQLIRIGRDEPFRDFLLLF